MCAYYIFLKDIFKKQYLKQIFKTICFALVPRPPAYFSSDIYPLNLSSNNMYSK